MAFNAPVYEVSWDAGRNWQEAGGSGYACGVGMLMRIRAADGRVIWQGRGISITRTCGGCEGTGKREYYEFEEIKP